jgi:hypothetical protein
MACVLLDGKRYGLDEPMDDHVQGRCTMLPITKPWRELGADVDEPGGQRQLARDWFQGLEPAEQQRMMGPLYEPWAAGQIDLGDIPQQHVDPVWGNSWTPKSLVQLLG